MSPSKPTLRAAYNNVYVLAVKHGLTRLSAVGQPPCSCIGDEALNPLLFSVTSVTSVAKKLCGKRAYGK